MDSNPCRNERHWLSSDGAMAALPFSLSSGALASPRITRQQQQQKQRRQQQLLSAGFNGIRTGEGMVQCSLVGKVMGEREQQRREGEDRSGLEVTHGEYVRLWWRRQQKQQPLSLQQQQQQGESMVDSPPPQQRQQAQQQRRRIQGTEPNLRRRRNLSNEELQAQVDALQVQLKQLQTEHLLQQEQVKQHGVVQQRRLSQQRLAGNELGDEEQKGGDRGVGKGKGRGLAQEEEEVEDEKQAQRLQVWQHHSKEWQGLDVVVWEEQGPMRDEAWQDEQAARVKARGTDQCGLHLKEQPCWEVCIVVVQIRDGKETYHDGMDVGNADEE
ncbi:unnamed protein product [Closterium sp. NIES-53]